MVIFVFMYILVALGFYLAATDTKDKWLWWEITLFCLFWPAAVAYVIAKIKILK